MRIIGIILAIFILGYGFEYDSTGIPIIIIERNFDNFWTDTIRDTCTCYNHNFKYWYIVGAKKNYPPLPCNLFNIYKEE